MSPIQVKELDLAIIIYKKYHSRVKKLVEELHLVHLQIDSITVQLSQQFIQGRTFQVINAEDSGNHLESKNQQRENKITSHTQSQISSATQRLPQKPPQQSSSFLSKVPRLSAPMAMLGTESTASHADNPGPGSYTEPLEWVKRNKLDEIKQIFKEQGQQKRDKIQKAIQEIEGDVKKKKIKPTIPSKKPPKNGYTGIKEDNPGPSGYNPKTEYVKTKSASALFSKSHVNREIFQVDEEAPENNTSSNFGSKVPNCKDLKPEKADIPGPGTYQPEIIKSNDHQPNKSKIGEIDALKTSTYIQNSNNQSTLKRVQDCPFVDIPERDKNPGPGDYFFEDAKDKILKRLKTQHYEALVKPKPPFNSQLERYCNRTLEKIDQVGPGAYIDINNPQNSSLKKTMLKFQSDRVFQQAYGIEQKPFGSSSERFLNKTQQAQQQREQANFGLASKATLDHLKMNKTQSQLNKSRQSRSQESFQFKSKAKRLHFQDQTDPNIIRINTESDQTQGSMVQLKYHRDQESTMQSHHQSQLFKIIQGKVQQSDKTSFNQLKINQLTQRIIPLTQKYNDSSQDRFGFTQIAKTTLQQTPGPGSYNISQPNSSRIHTKTQQKAGFSSTEKKFNPRFNSYVKPIETQEAVGPGAYHRQENTSMLKKSYNMALEGTSYV